MGRAEPGMEGVQVFPDFLGGQFPGAVTRRNSNRGTADGGGYDVGLRNGFAVSPTREGKGRDRSADGEDEKGGSFHSGMPVRSLSLRLLRDPWRVGRLGFQPRVRRRGILLEPTSHSNGRRVHLTL